MEGNIWKMSKIKKIIKGESFSFLKGLIWDGGNFPTLLTSPTSSSWIADQPNIHQSLGGFELWKADYNDARSLGEIELRKADYKTPKYFVQVQTAAHSRQNAGQWKEEREGSSG